ncbi:alkyl sulfatase dimerization domain-containing protein [Variovorax sp. WS11]|uniref:alkyl sulfatase dimerization domain-containing protein n=1 Tax=Variovorax sp. WS11 TaxID=1105204 RepID=UPI0011B21778|nr:alkyl sulfatase dimerization domain-containing protein [Variovorax sp. WS11]NDZ18130.1 MBL fold metallo-hydrolase [Variovorax sp. WS11]
MNNAMTISEQLWQGAVPMEDWTAAVAGGSITPVGEDVVVVHTSYVFGNVTAIRTADGLVLIDTGSREIGDQIFAAIRKWDGRPVHTVIYTHGHIDHTFGVHLYDAEADERGVARPRIIAHRGVLERFSRYDATHGLNSVVMGRQFNIPGYAFPDRHRRPDQIYDDVLSLEVGGVHLELTHGRGETDDATFVWMPQKRVLISGDFIIWAFPNAGNPRKVQRYAPDWAHALRRMEALEPETVVPGHGPVVFGAARAKALLDDTASVLESLIHQSLDLMNQGKSLEEVLAGVVPPAELLARPYLKPKYDDPEFVIRGIYHLYAGWFDGNPAHLKPAPAAELARELAALCGGATVLADRAATLLKDGKTRLAAHLVELASATAPDDAAIQRVRADVYAGCAAAETSLIGKAIFSVYRRDAEGLMRSPGPGR